MDTIENVCDRVSFGDKQLAAHMAYLNTEGFKVVAVHAVAGTFFIFATREVTRSS